MRVIISENQRHLLKEVASPIRMGFLYMRHNLDLDESIYNMLQELIDAHKQGVDGVYKEVYDLFKRSGVPETYYKYFAKHLGWPHASELRRR